MCRPGTNLCGLNFQVPTVLWEHKLALAWKNESLSFSLDLCIFRTRAASTNRDHQIPSITYERVASLRVAVNSEKGFIHPSPPRPPPKALTSCFDLERAADNQQRNVFVNMAFRQSFFGEKKMTSWTLPLA